MKKFVAALSAGTALVLAAPTAAPAKDKFCSEVSELKKTVDTFDKLSDGDFKSAFKMIDGAARKMKSAEGRAPSAIKSDWKTMSTFMGKLSKIVAKLKDVSLANADKEVAKLAPEIEKLGSDKKVETSSDKITAWAKKECKIDLNA